MNFIVYLIHNELIMLNHSLHGCQIGKEKENDSHTTEIPISFSFPMTYWKLNGKKGYLIIFFYSSSIASCCTQYYRKEEKNQHRVYVVQLHAYIHGP